MLKRRPIILWTSRAALAVLLLMTTTAATCQHPPANWTPAGKRTWYNDRVRKALDVIRDTAVDANATTPPLMATATTRKIVTFHESALKTIQADAGGWLPTVEKALDELVKDIPASEATLVQPYIALAKTLMEALK